MHPRHSHSRFPHEEDQHLTCIFTIAKKSSRGEKGKKKKKTKKLDRLISFLFLISSSPPRSSLSPRPLSNYCATTRNESNGFSSFSFFFSQFLDGAISARAGARVSIPSGFYFSFLLSTSSSRVFLRTSDSALCFFSSSSCSSLPIDLFSFLFSLRLHGPASSSARP